MSFRRQLLVVSTPVVALTCTLELDHFVGILSMWGDFLCGQVRMEGHCSSIERAKQGTGLKPLKDVGRWWSLSYGVLRAQVYLHQRRPGQGLQSQVSLFGPHLGGQKAVEAGAKVNVFTLELH